MKYSFILPLNNDDKENNNFKSFEYKNTFNKTEKSNKRRKLDKSISSLSRNTIHIFSILKKSRFINYYIIIYMYRKSTSKI